MLAGICISEHLAIAHSDQIRIGLKRRSYPLAYLIGLKVDRLKIDRSFVRDVARSETNQKLISAMVSLGQSLSLEIVVEGVETPEDAAILARLPALA